MRKFIYLSLWVIFFFSLQWNSEFPRSSSTVLGSLYAQETKMLITQTACVDIPKIINIVSQNHSMQDFLLNSEGSHREKSIAIEKRIQELKDYLLENQNNLTSQEINAINEEIEYQNVELEQIRLTEDQSINTEEIILKGIYRLIKEIAEQEGLSIIIEKTSAVIYNKPEVDITDKVIKIMSKQLNQNEEEETE